MAKTKHITRRSSGFNLGGQQAEADPLLDRAFYSTSQYRAIANRTDPHCFFIGRTGSGKSALLRRLQHESSEHVIRIAPEDLALTYVADLQSVRWLDAQGVHLDPLFIALWKHVLLIEIIRHRYAVHSSDAKQNFIATISEKIKKDRSKVEALRYLEEFQGRFWCEADERVREIANKFETQIKAEAPIPGTGISAGAGYLKSGEERTELVARYQRIVNETQLPRLNQMIKVLDEDILNSPQNFTYVVIDDLDQDWVDDRVSNSLIRCLFRAVLDLKRVSNLKVIVALRTNIFEVLDFGRRTGGQEEKFRALSMRIRWSEGDLTAMLDERTRAAGEAFGTELSGVRDILPATNKARGDALDYMMRRTLMRPRDIIAFLNECTLDATADPRITWDKIYAAEDRYSRNRLLALRDEWKPTYPGIDKVLRAFEECPAVMNRDQLSSRLDDVAILSADAEFEGSTWLGQLTIDFWRTGSEDWIEQYGPLVRFLYNLGFLGAGSSKGRVIYSYEEPDYFDQRNKISTCERFVLHPAYRRALDAVPASKRVRSPADIEADVLT